MAIKVLMLLILCSVQVLAEFRDCSRMDSIRSCDQCIKCGGSWCIGPVVGPRCSATPAAGWCPDARESLQGTAPAYTPRSNSSADFWEVTTTVGVTAMVPIVYSAASEKKANVAIEHPRIPPDVGVTSSTVCDGDNCTVTVSAIPGQHFCSNNGGSLQTVHLTLSLEDADKLDIRLQVRCSCECNRRVELRSRKCSSRGDFFCGTCDCENGWRGDECETRSCPPRRGDLQKCTNPQMEYDICSGNGECGNCAICDCYVDRPGWQYYDRKFCSDLCLTIGSDCEACLQKHRPGEQCNKCNLSPIYVDYNKENLHQTDNMNRTVWVTCNWRVSECDVEFAAMKENGETFLMISSLCATGDSEAVAVSTYNRHVDSS